MQIQTESGGPYGPFEEPLDGGGTPGDGSSPRGPKVATPDGGDLAPDDSGTCVTATCISFVTVGYCVVVIAMAVAYKKWKPKDRSKRFDRDLNEGEDILDDETEVLNPAFEQHIRATGGASVRGSAVMA